MSTEAAEKYLPSQVSRLIRDYEPWIQTRLAELLVECGCLHAPKLADFQRCLTVALEDFALEIRETDEQPQPDITIVERSLAEFRDGHCRPIEEFRAELPAQ